MNEAGTSGMPKQWKVNAGAAYVAVLVLFAFAPEIGGWAVQQDSGRVERVMLLALVAGFGIGAAWLWVLARERQAAYGRLGPLTIYLMLVAVNAAAKGAGYGVLWAGGFVLRAGATEAAAGVIVTGLRGIKAVQAGLAWAGLACFAWGAIWLAAWLFKGRPDVWKRVPGLVVQKAHEGGD